MHRYNSLAVYATNHAIKCTDFLDLSDSAQRANGTNYSEGGYLFNEIIPIKGIGNATTFLIRGYSVESTSERGELVMALRIVNNELVNIPFLKRHQKRSG